MRAPTMASVVQRRLLVSYRTDPELVASLLPRPLRPQLVNGWAVAGICLIRLGQLRPRWVPARLGLRSENAAHRVAVTWETANGPASGVYILRQDSGSRVTTTAGGRLFPGSHHRARFRVREAGRDLQVAFSSADGTGVEAHARRCDRWPASQLFDDLEAASAFFRKDPDGYSPGAAGGCLDGMRLQTVGWHLEPLDVVEMRSTFFDDPARFPAGTATLDCALLMRDVPATWTPLPTMPVGTNGAPGPADDAATLTRK